jgi:hypothetical protein
MVPGVIGAHKGGKHFYICFDGKIFENLFKKPHSQKVQIYWQGDLMAIKKSNFANMTQVSNVAPGPLLEITRFLKANKC